MLAYVVNIFCLARYDKMTLIKVWVHQKILTFLLIHFILGCTLFQVNAPENLSPTFTGHVYRGDISDTFCQKGLHARK